MAVYNGIEKYIFSDMYLFFLKYQGIPDEPYYWNCCEQDMKNLRFKYKNHAFAEMILDSTYSQLRHKVKNIPMHDSTGTVVHSYDEWDKQLAIAKQTKSFK